MINLQFNRAFTGDHFKLSADGGKGPDVTLAKGAGATFAGFNHDVLNFVSDYHRGLTEGRMMPVHGLDRTWLSTASGAASDVTGYGFASHVFVDHGLAHVTLGVCKV